MAQRRPRHARRTFALPRPGTRVVTHPTEVDIPVSIRHTPHGNQHLQAEPPGPGQAPFRLSLEEVLPGSTHAIEAAGRMVFHMVGDTGGVKRPEVQQVVADHMVADLDGLTGADKPLFFYHLGDVVYYFGESGNYADQYYLPYEHYQAPIFAIPGNHDGDLDTRNPAPRGTLAAFLDNFCAPAPALSPDAGEVSRDTMTQPNPFWTLETPLATIVGLYTNVPEGGTVSDQQRAWFEAELRAAPQDRALLVALHHPVYSADAYHTGSLAMGEVLDAAMGASGRIADAIFTAHVHNYQRYTRTYQGRQIPYIVAGSGGYWHLHPMVSDLNGIVPPVKISGSDVALENFIADRHGFMRVEVTAQQLTVTYFTVPRPQEPWSSPARAFEQFTVDLQQHRVQPSLLK